MKISKVLEVDRSMCAMLRTAEEGLPAQLGVSPLALREQREYLAGRERRLKEFLKRVLDLGDFSYNLRTEMSLDPRILDVLGAPYPPSPALLVGSTADIGAVRAEEGSGSNDGGASVAGGGLSSSSSRAAAIVSSEEQPAVCLLVEKEVEPPHRGEIEGVGREAQVEAGGIVIDDDCEEGSVSSVFSSGTSSEGDGGWGSSSDDIDDMAEDTVDC